MPVSDFTFYDCVAEDVGRGVHNWNADTLKIALSDTAPVIATHAVLADADEISAGFGYSAGGPTVVDTAFSQVDGVATLIGDDLTITAVGGAIGPFQYAVIYNATPAGGALIGYWDYGESITIEEGDALDIDLDQIAGILTLTRVNP
jgi:hypothetical protein